MTFTDWEIDAIRRGLNAYRIAKARNGRLLPWKALTHAILMSEVTEHAYPEDGDEPEFKEEALRRFANGSQVLQPDKLADLQAFLIHHRMLSEDEFGKESSLMAEAKSVQSLLGADDARIYISSMREFYRTSRTLDEHTEIAIELRIVPQPDDELFMVEETVIRTQRDPSSELAYSAKDKFLVMKMVRRGYGVLVTRGQLAHIVLHDYQDSERIHLVELMPPAGERFPHMILARLGQAPAMPQDRSDREPAFSDYNIFRFEPRPEWPYDDSQG